MDAVTVVAIVGATSTLLSATFAAWASFKQRRTEEFRLGLDAMREMLTAYKDDNADLRNRVFTAEQRVTDLTGQVNRCESDKTVLHQQVEALERRLGDA